MTVVTLAMLMALRPWLGAIHAEARRAHVDPLTLAVIVWHESRGNPSLVSTESNGSCSVGLAMINVPDCNPERIRELRNPATNLRAAAATLRATGKWCKRHRADRYCRAGERAFRGGGAVNRYAGRSTTFAGEIKLLRGQIARLRPGRPD